MTTPQDPPQTPPPDDGGAPRRLTRSTSDRMLGGVAGGLGRYFGIDPLLFRVAFFVLTLAGGAGLLAYVALWLFVPGDAAGAEAPAAGRRGGIIAGAVLLVLVLVVVADGPFIFPFGPMLLFVALGAVVLLAVLAGARGPGDGLGRALLVVASIAVAIVVAVVGGFAAALGGGVIVAAIVLVAGGILVVSAFTGGARWLVLPALALAATTAFVAAADIRLDGGVGERSYRPASVGELQDRYELGMGELTVDLRDVDFPAGEHAIGVDLGLGKARVLVPEDVCVALTADLGAGGVELYGQKAGGVDVEVSERPPAPASVPLLVVDAEIGLGEVEVDTIDDRGFPGFWHGDFGEPGPPGRSGACA